ncbi:MAG: NADH-quinone oxidoreductase subunit D, partial [bacterium]
GGVARPIPEGWLEAVGAFTKMFPGCVQEYEDLLTENEIFIQRTKDVGYISAQDAIDLGLSGPSLRASGVEWDIRKAEPYLVYDRLDWKVPVGEAGDTYERYLLRMEEMRQSCSIISQCLDEFPISGPLNIDNPKVILPERELLHKSMETLIHHFLLASEGLQVPPGEVYCAIEAPKGELGYYLYSAGGSKPYRVKVRSPGFVNLQSFEKMCIGRPFADIVAVIGGLDIVLGDVDR